MPYDYGRLAGIDEACKKLLEEKFEKVDLITLLRTFKREGMDNFIVIRKEKFKNYIPKTKVQEKIEKLKKEYEIALEENSTKAFILKCQIDILEKLMEEK